MEGEEAKTNLQSFWEHALTLRRYFLLGGAFFVVSAVAFFAFSEDILTNYLLRPLSGAPLVFLSPLGPFLFKMKVAFMAAFVVSLPAWLLLMSQFVGEAISARKRSYFYAFVASAGLLGIASVVATNEYLVPVSLAALSNFVVPGTSLMITAESYMSFVLLSMTVAFFVLELPIIVIALSYIGVVSPHALARQRKLVFVGILILLAILTPTNDPITLLIVAVPAMALLELGILIAKRMR